MSEVVFGWVLGDPNKDEAMKEYPSIDAPEGGMVRVLYSLVI